MQKFDITLQDISSASSVELNKFSLEEKEPSEIDKSCGAHSGSAKLGVTELLCTDNSRNKIL